MAETYQVRDGVVYGDGTQWCATMGPVRVARDVVELETRVKLHRPLRRLKVVRRDRELGERNAAPRAPEDDAAATLRRAVDSGLQDAEAHLIPVAITAHARFSKVVRWARGGRGLGWQVGKCNVPERCECAQDELDDAVNDDVSFLWSRLVDLELMTQEPEDILQKEEFRPVELHIRQHVAHQGVPAIPTWPTLGRGSAITFRSYLGSSACY